MDKDLELLHKKIDFLTDQVMQTQRRQREMEELRQDLTPIATDLFKQLWKNWMRLHLILVMRTLSIW